MAMAAFSPLLFIVTAAALLNVALSGEARFSNMGTCEYTLPYHFVLQGYIKNLFREVRTNSK